MHTKYTRADIKALNEALNEATLIGVDFSKDKNRLAVTISPVAINEYGEIAPDNRLLLIFKPVGRFAASYRLGHWDDKSAKTVVFEPEKIQGIVQSFQHLDIYGCDFIDSPANVFEKSEDRLSFDYRNAELLNTEHTFEFFQDDSNKYLVGKVWFNNLNIFDPKGNEIIAAKFIANAKRAWESKDTLSQFGIHHLLSDEK